ncbi:hypothetical protein PybrP1_002781 [[Pythium] brassicae (nom. inval.)]|nr:hypothetical protein PybrP1_002781 [[Pythium] brassicae (nom. inval.)]
MEVCVSYLVMFLFSALLLRYTAFVAHQLAAGDASFKPRAILPTFRALLATLAAAALALIGVNVGLVVAFSADSLSVEVYLAGLYAGRHFLLALAPAFMLQTSLSAAALLRAVLATLALTLSAAVLFAVPALPQSAELYASFALLAAFFGWLLWRPALRASPAVARRYAAFALAHLALALAHVVCVDRDELDAGAPFSSVSSFASPSPPSPYQQQQRWPRPQSLSEASAPWEERAAASPYAAFAYAANDVARKVPFHAPYSERIDVYALGVAFWELLHPRAAALPRPGAKSCGDGDSDAEWRPQFADDVPAELRELLKSTWRRDTRARPTAAQLVRTLEAIQQAALADGLECAAAAVDPSHLGLDGDPSSSARSLVDGAGAVRSLVSSNQVQHSWEAVRLGNAWMEAGMLHEERHALPFRNRASTRYYFSPSSRRTVDSTLSDDDEHSVIVIGMSLSTRGSFGGGGKSVGGAGRAARKRCLCRAHARQAAQPRRAAWRAFATAESRALAQHDFTLSSSYESLLTSAMFVDNGFKE